MRIIRLLVLCASAAAANEAESPLGIRLVPEAIEMGAFFSGARVRISGTVGAGSEVLIIVRGAEREEVFNYRGRVGPIWINSGKVRISQAPSLFLSLGSDYAFVVLDWGVVEALELDEAAVARRMRVDGAPIDRFLVCTSFLRMKAGTGLYRSDPGGVRLGEPGGTERSFSAEFDWPAKAPPGAYEVRVYECRNGSVARTCTLPLQAAKVGFPAWLSVLADEQAAAYGVLAVIGAVVAGFGIDFLARSL